MSFQKPQAWKQLHNMIGTENSYQEYFLHPRERYKFLNNKRQIGKQHCTLLHNKLIPGITNLSCTVSHKITSMHFVAYKM